jgi:hypothetical protein
LAIKATLLSIGITERELADKKKYGHNHRSLAERLIRERPYLDDVILQDVVDDFPDYIGSRYKDAGLTRLSVVQLALGAQFIAASSVRRLGTTDRAAELEQAAWPGRRILPKSSSPN